MTPPYRPSPLGRRRPRRRHGVLLLIVLCVLFMFLLLALTYTVVASKERAMTRNYARFERASDPPNVVLDELAMVLFRDTNDTHSPFRTWSLLEGIYGNVSFRGTITSLQGATTQGQTAIAGGQFLTISSTAPNMINAEMQTPNFLKGCVLTMLTGQCAGLSTRIVASSATSSVGSVTVMRFESDAGVYDPSGPSGSTPGDTFLINGRPYSGMGRGYNITRIAAGTPGPACDAMDPNGRPYALLPNPVGFLPSGSYTDPAGPGGANLDYTAADYNNCYLGLVYQASTQANNQTQIISEFLPSFYRPDLYSYWQQQVPNLSGNAQLLRQVSFRPNSVDDGVFTSYTNPSFNPAAAPNGSGTQFDVDNMGGGAPDSIWIDPGLPVTTSRDGRPCKILVAPCIVDLDGRVNVNAHGSLFNTDTLVNKQPQQQGPNPPAGISTTSMTPPQSATMQMMAGVAAGTPVVLPLGQGIGSAEVNLNAVFTPAEVSAILQGTGTANNGWDGRYGGSPGASNAGYSITNRALDVLKFFEYPTGNPINPSNPLTSFGTPPDVKGRHMIAVDPRGQPIYFAPRASTYNPYYNSPYWNSEIITSGSGAKAEGESPYGYKFDREVPRPGRYASQSATPIDDPFTVGELETVLREYDGDMRSLPQRLYQILPSVQPNSQAFSYLQTQYGIWQRNQITTDSSDLPSPNFQVPHSLRAWLAQYYQSRGISNVYQAFGITDLLNARLQPATALAGNTTTEIAKLLPPELIAGERMDINRPFGNGQDDNQNGLVDEPGGISSNNPSAPDSSPEQLIGNTILPQTLGHFPQNSGYYNTKVNLNLVNGSAPNNGWDPALSQALPAGVAARQLMARHLYALAMMFADPTYITSGVWSAESGLTATQYQQLYARRIAQWAINCVSFRDSTSIMTPFMYQWDIYQSTYPGWWVNGDPGITNQVVPATDPVTGNALASAGQALNYSVVWACKPPDAVLTETLAFHDKRVADTAWDTGNNKKTTDTPPDAGGTSGSTSAKPPGGNFDQVQIPQGSLFLEVNCTRNPNTPTAPSDLYTLRNGSGSAWDPVNNPWCLNLSKMAPDQNPVWRIMVSQSRLVSQNNDLLDSGTPNYIGTHPESTTFEPTTDQSAKGMPWQQMNLFDTQQSQNVTCDRVIWLGATPPPATVRQSLNTPGWAPALNAQIYYNRSGQILVAPGSYAVIGPRKTTYIGSQGTFDTVGTWGKPAAQSITLTSPMPTNSVIGPNGATNMPGVMGGNMKTGGIFGGQGVIVAADPPLPAYWSNGTAYAAQSAATAGIGVNISEPLPAGVASGKSTYYPQPTVQNTAVPGGNGPYDSYGGLNQTGLHFLDQPLEELAQNPLPTYPLVQEKIVTTRTNVHYKLIFLQRLADPTSGYDALRNPYITVDWMPVDLTVFNGEDTAAHTNPTDAAAAKPQVSMVSRQRGGSTNSTATSPAYKPLAPNLWAPISPTDTLGNQATAIAAGSNDNFPYALTHSLGYLNQGFGVGMTLAQAGVQSYVGDPIPTQASTAAQQVPFPWINWNARPYASPIELFNVPFSAPERLLFEYNSPSTQVNYSTTPAATATLPVTGFNMYQGGTNLTNSRAPFGHLLNFLNSTDSSFTPGLAANLYQMMEYLQVPSRFVGTETYFNPSSFAYTPGSQPLAGTQYFQPPFNHISNYRDPGKINLNTLTSPLVYAALMNGVTTPAFTDLCNARTLGNSGNVINPGNTSLPTYFPAPFRSAAGADLVPLASMMAPAVNATLLRPSLTNPNAPLFSPSIPAVPTQYSNSQRDSYFAYQTLSRVANNVTTRSNVFAVWLTIGYFEAIPNSQTVNGQPHVVVDAGHPDGWQIGAEIGSDTGDVERHRAFYIFDRSIPVGYERGQNHNVNRAILLKRYIE